MGTKGTNLEINIHFSFSSFLCYYDDEASSFILSVYLETLLLPRKWSRSSANFVTMLPRSAYILLVFEVMK